MMRHTGFGAGIAAVVVSILIWGAQFPVAKTAYAALDPYTLTAIRYSIALLPLMVLLAAREGMAAFSLGARPLRLAVAGVFGMAGSPLFVFVGLFYTRPEHAVILIALQPSIAVIAQWLLHGKRPAPFTLGAIVVAFAGVVLVVLGHGVQPGEAKLIGDLLVLSGVLCWITYTMMLASFPEFGALRFTTLTCIIGTAVSCAVTLIAHLAGAASLPDVATLVSVTPHMLFLSVFGVTVSMLLWNYGNARIGPLNAVLLLNLMPVETYVIRYLQGAHFTWQEWVGATLVVGALMANNLYQRRGGRGTAD